MFSAYRGILCGAVEDVGGYSNYLVFTLYYVVNNSSIARQVFWRKNRATDRSIITPFS